MRIVDLIEAAKAHPRVQRSRTLQRLGQVAQRGLWTSGVQTWGTKSFEFWTLLTTALWLVRPRSLLELGGGRSTYYLADYAAKAGARFASAEQSRSFARRLRRGLAAAFLDPRCVHHVPVGASLWYDEAALDRVAPAPCEGLFVDGPVGEQENLGRARRDGAAALDWLSRRVAAPRLLIVDDVHRPENLALLATLLGRAPALRALLLGYVPGRTETNLVALAVEEGAFGRLETGCATLGIAVRRAALP